MLTNLGDITNSLTTLMKAALDAEESTNEDFVVSAAPPDLVTDEKRVCAYLFHVMESPEYKNLVPQGGGGPAPVRHIPLGLILQYIVTLAMPDETNLPDSAALDQDARDQQQVIGIIARAIHDYPIITDTTTIDVEGVPTTILHENLRGLGTCLELIMRPAKMEEAINFWSSDDRGVPRLSLFLEARVAVLEPKPPEIMPGVVLSVGQFVYPASRPQLMGSRNSISFVPPEPPPVGTTVTIQATPARVALFDVAHVGDLTARGAALLNNNRLILDGVGLSGGTRLLSLKRDGSEIVVDLDTIHVDNTSWEFVPQAGSVSLRIWDEVTDVDGVARAIRPGSYAARVIVVREVLGKELTEPSNEITFSLGAQILSVDVAAGFSTYTLELASAALEPDAEVVFAVGPASLEQVPVAATLRDGQFKISGTTIDFRLAPGSPVPSGPTPLAVQLVIDGATSPPEWVTSAAPVDAFVDTVTPLTDGHYQLSIGGPIVDIGTLVVSVGATTLTLVGGTPNAGEYEVTGPTTIELVLPPETIPSTASPVAVVLELDGIVLPTALLTEPAEVTSP